MMMSADRILVHAGYQGGAKGRADRRGRIGLGKEHPVSRHSIHIRRLDELFTIAGEVSGHIINDKPQDIMPFYCRTFSPGKDKQNK
jgi:hypothetical protein